MSFAVARFPVDRLIRRVGYRASEVGRQAMKAALIVALVVGAYRPAFAYLDPGTGSIILQLLLGGVAGALMLLKLYWYRIKRFFGRSEKTDGSKGKGR